LISFSWYGNLQKYYHSKFLKRRGLLRRRTRRRLRLPHGWGKADNENYKSPRTFSIVWMITNKILSEGVGSRGETPVPFSFCFVFLLGTQKKNEEMKIKFIVETYKLTLYLQIAIIDFLISY